MKKALIFDPYLDTLGGGERYVLSFATTLENLGFEVTLAWDSKTEILKAQELFGLNLNKIKLSPSIYELFSHKSSLIKRFLLTKEYDLVFYVSDGSIPFLFSKNNLVHLQVPFKTLGGNHIINLVKSLFIHKFVYNSQFTMQVHEKHLPKSKSYVLYPPIDTQNFQVGKKEKLILSVSRFDPSLTSKRQDAIIEAFRSLSEKNLDYKLVLAGGLKGDEAPVNKLREQAKGLNVDILVRPSFSKLKDLYAQAKFFWHAAGFEVDETNNPEQVEHFGITTLEAMSAGAVPVVIAKGGQKEIITPDTGILCDSQTDMTSETLKLIADEHAWKEMSKKAIDRSKLFSVDTFNIKIKELL